MADIEGFTRDQIMAFSKRRQQIEAWRDVHGIADTAAGNEVAALATREPKRDNPVEALMPQWLERAAEVGITPEKVSIMLDRSHDVTVPDPQPPPGSSVFSRGVDRAGVNVRASRRCQGRC